MTELSIPYVATRHPDSTDPSEVIARPQDGTNCQLFVVVLARARGFQLPALRSAELLEDRDHTIIIEGLDVAESGDIIALTTNTQTDPRYFHVGMLSRTNDGRLFITHNEREGGSARVESLEDVLGRPKYEKVAWIKRPIIENVASSNSQFLTDHGLGHLAKEG